MPSRNALDGLMKWLRRDEWSGLFRDAYLEHIEAPCLKAGVEVDELNTIVDEHWLANIFGFAFEDFLTREFDGGRNIVDDYLKRRGWQESVSTRAYMQALRTSVASLYEVSGIVAGESFLARDLVRGGEPMRVMERTASRSLSQWDRLAVRLVDFGDRTEMSGGLLFFDHDASTAILDAVAKSGSVQGRKSAAVRDAALRGLAPQFTHVFLSSLIGKTLGSDVPETRNSDGDEIAFTTVTYALAPHATAAAVAARLDELAVLRAADDGFWNWVEAAQGGSDIAPRSSGLRTFVTTMEDGAVVLGNIELKGGTLSLTANSANRCRRGRALIEPVLGALVAEPSVDTQTLKEMEAAHRSKPSTKSNDSGLPADVERALVLEMLDRHYMQVIDDPIPVLGNISPRQAARTARGRVELVEWLKLLENHSARREAGDPMAEYDVGWMWEELGVSDLRK